MLVRRALTHLPLQVSLLEWNDRPVKVLVVEGESAGVATVHAPGSGDDEIVARCRHHTGCGDDVTVASADRGLLSRLAPLGAATLGPRTLRAELASCR